MSRAAVTHQTGWHDGYRGDRGVRAAWNAADEAERLLAASCVPDAVFVSSSLAMISVA
jgi:hypothetical protein